MPGTLKWGTYLSFAPKYRGKSPKVVAEEWLAKLQFFPFASTDASIEVDDPGGKALRDAGLITELAEGLKRLADPTITLEEVSAALSQVEGWKGLH